MLLLFSYLRDCFRARVVLQAEILALRHQVLVLQRLGRLRKFWRSGGQLCLEEPEPCSGEIGVEGERGGQMVPPHYEKADVIH